MSRMLRLEMVGLVLLACTQIFTEHRDFYEPRTQYGYYQRYHEGPDHLTREVRVKQGRLRGMVVQPRSNHDLQPVDVFLGVPYAEPPVGSLRFSPPRSPEPWRVVRQSLDFAPVCPQVVPKLRDEVKPARYEYLERLLPYLKNQSEDCLYLNIYAPHQPEGPHVRLSYLQSVTSRRLAGRSVGRSVGGEDERAMEGLRGCHGRGSNDRGGE